jgi:hypothetical protein
MEDRTKLKELNNLNKFELILLTYIDSKQDYIDFNNILQFLKYIELKKDKSDVYKAIKRLDELNLIISSKEPKNNRLLFTSIEATL